MMNSLSPLVHTEEKCVSITRRVTGQSPRIQIERLHEITGILQVSCRTPETECE